MRESVKKLVLIPFAMMIIGCAGKEMVMTPGMTISATNLNGTIGIKAGEGLERSYFWDNKQITVKMLPRNERWLGSLGAYSPGGGIDVHAVVEEGQQHFCCEKEALEWLSWRNEVLDWIYTHEGLVIGYRSAKNPIENRFFLHVYVWQFFINGQMPKNLPGAKTNRIAVSYGENVFPRRPPPGKFTPSKPKRINGRLYSGKSIDYIQEKGASPDVIEKVIQFGKKDQRGNYFVYYNFGEDFGEDIGSFKDANWVKTDRDGRVVLIGW